MFISWARDRSVTDAMDEIEIDSRTAVDIYQWLREVCTTKLLQTNITLGGPGVVIQIDESMFRHKPKVIMIYLPHKNDDLSFVYRNTEEEQLHRRYVYSG